MKKSFVSLLTFLLLLLFITIFYLIDYIHPLLFMSFICILYFASFPRYLFSPKNIIFAYYFLWYALAPAFAFRFRDYSFTSNEEKLAFLMLFCIYGISMVFLTFCESYFEARVKTEETIQDNLDSQKISRITQISMAMVLVSLFIYINQTGGISSWIEDSTLAFIGRFGAGPIYLIFLHSLMMFASAYGVTIYKNKNIFSLFKFCFFILILFPFIGSKGQIILLILIVTGLFLINRDTISKWTAIALFISTSVFFIGIYQRNYTWMTFADVIPYSLDYFNTFEMLVILVRDFDPDWLKTVLLPFNWFLLKFGEYIHVPFHDMSIWLTSIYYPIDYSVGGTQQWPIEADFYLSFYFIFGIPFLMIYLAWVSFAFHMAKQRYVSWILIYIIEFVYIISHYRGGLLNYWYIWLIPFYIIVIFIYGKRRVSNNTHE